MRKKGIYTMAALLVLAVCLTGCTGSAEMPEETTKRIVLTAADELEAGNTPTASAANTEPQHFVETVNENFHIDAMVTGCPVDGLAGVYTGEPLCFTQNNIDSFLKVCKDEVLSSTEKKIDGKTLYDAQCKSGNRVLYLSSSQYHPLSVFQYINKEKYKMYHDYPIYNSEESFLTNRMYTVGWMFEQPKNFEFATEREAEQHVRAALTALGIPNLILLRTLYVDYENMEKAGKLLATDENYAPLGDRRENNGYPIRDDWSEADNAYMFSFELSIDGVPISYRHDTQDTATYCGTQVIVWYTHEGIAFLSVETPWTVGKLEISPSEVIPASEALTIAKEKFEQNLVYQDKRIEALRMEYQYFQNRKSWMLRPVWQVRLSYKIKDCDIPYFEYMTIDAHTGKEL